MKPEILGRVGAVLACLAAGPASAQAPRLGTIDFPTSGAPAARAPFIRGVLLLHSFEYGDAARAFREAQRLDSGFALAYWGEAMTYTHPVWNEQDGNAARAALQRPAPCPAGPGGGARLLENRPRRRARAAHDHAHFPCVGNVGRGGFAERAGVRARSRRLDPAPLHPMAGLRVFAAGSIRRRVPTPTTHARKYESEPPGTRRRRADAG